MISDAENSPEKCVYNRKIEEKDLKIIKLKRMVNVAMQKLASQEEELNKTQRNDEIKTKMVLNLQENVTKLEIEKESLLLENRKLMNLNEELELLLKKLRSQKVVKSMFRLELKFK